jgi:hypothetical protein
MKDDACSTNTMTENPYSSTKATKGVPRSKRLPFVMACLAVLLGTAMLCVAASGIVGALSSVSLARGQVPLDVIVATALAAFCGVIAIFSALCWSKQRSQLAMFLLLGSVGVFLAGRRLVAMAMPL